MAAPQKFFKKRKLIAFLYRKFRDIPNEEKGPNRFFFFLGPNSNLGTPLSELASELASGVTWGYNKPPGATGYLAVPQGFTYQVAGP
jgi:hypothetical protein